MKDHPLKPNSFGVGLIKIPSDSKHVKTEGTSKPSGAYSSVYDLPEGTKTTSDIIEHHDMDYNRGNILKAVIRWGQKSGIDEVYDIDKIIYFAQRAKAKILRDGVGADES